MWKMKFPHWALKERTQDHIKKLNLNKLPVDCYFFHKIGNLSINQSGFLAFVRILHDVDSVMCACTCTVC